MEIGQEKMERIRFHHTACRSLGDFIAGTGPWAVVLSPYIVQVPSQGKLK